jgi:transcriptional regulator with XRE-family HTH domain
MVTILSSTQRIANIANPAKYRLVAKKTAAKRITEIDTLPLRVRLARERVPMTQRALAKKLGIDPGQISRLESGKRGQGLELATVIQLARVLGVPVGWLAANEGEMGPVPVFRERVSDGRRRDDPDETDRT